MGGVLQSLRGSHTNFIDGVEGVRDPTGKPYLRLEGIHRNGEPESVHVRLVGFGNDRRASLPAVNGTRLLSAVPIVEDNRILALSGGRAYAVGVLFIDAARLSFTEINPIFTATSQRPFIWPGGEGVGVAYTHAGDRARVEQQQLFVVREGQHILVADDCQRVARVSFEAGHFCSTLATRDDLIAHVIARGMHAIHTAETKWCLRMLKQLGTREGIDVVLARGWRIDQNFKFDWSRL